MKNKPLHTLIIEDDSEYADMMKSYLEGRKEPFFVTIVADMRRAVEKLQADPFDLVILDLHLPDGNGLELFDRVHTAAPAAAVLIVSGAPDDEDFSLRAAERGAQDYLTKGDFDWKTFIRAVHYAITRKKMEEDLRQNVVELKAVEEKLRSTNEALHRKVHELDRLIHIMMGREERILQLKEENKTLKGDGGDVSQN